MTSKPVSPKHRVAALSARGRVQPPALVSVDLGDHEDVRWTWTHPQDGPSFVSGYRIVPRLPRDWLRNSEGRSDG